MKVNFEFKDVVEIEPYTDNGCYLIGVVFKDNEVMSYGYRDEDKFSKDYMELISNLERVRQ